ncbi:MAG: FAD-dependent oxidoreductase [Pyrodictiaceae archaeon]
MLPARRLERGSMKFLRCKPDKIPAPTGKRVAIIGSGPAGLGAAGVLRCQGHEVHVYEQFPEPGGLMIFGIPEYHVPKAGVRKGIKELEEAGVIFHTGTRVICCKQGKPDNEIEHIIKPFIKEKACLEEIIEDYDAILIATGAWKSRRLNIPGEDLEGVYPALEWLADFSMYQHGYKRLEEIPPVYGKVMVIGGGLTAVDAVEVPLKYLGERIEKVYLSYRRTRKEAPMGEKEFNRLIEQYGIEALELTLPVRFIGDDKGHVKQVVLQRTKLVQEPGAKRPKPVPIPGSEFTVDVDIVFVAVGEVPSPPFENGCCGIEVEKWGAIKTDEKFRTTREKVFAAGDVKHGPSLIGPALKSGIDAARFINEYLRKGTWDF